MLNTFNDSQENGLLQISYPMVESIRHQRSSFYQYETHPTNNLSQYKEWVKAEIRNGTFDTKYQNWGLYDLATWQEISNVNLQRANYLLNSEVSVSKDPIQPLDIFIAQKEHHIPKQEIAVLSSFPLTLHEFYGSDLFDKFET